MTRKKELMTKRILNSTLALALAGAMLFGSFSIPGGKASGFPIGLQTAYAADNPLDILCEKEILNNNLDTIRNNLDVLKLSVGKLAPADKTFFENLTGGFAPVGALGGAYSTATMVLKMAGIMKDPTAESLAKISTTLQGMDTTLTNMNSNLQRVANSLNDLKFAVDKVGRASETRDMISTTKDFYACYVKPLKDLMQKYQVRMLGEFEKWYAKPDKNSITIHDRGICLQSKQVNEAMKGCSYDVNDYRDTILQVLSRNISAWADQGCLTADQSFYTSWKKMSAQEKEAEAKLVAEECYNALAEDISCQYVNTNPEFVSDVYFAFTEYCGQLATENSALDAQLKALYLTHAFEGEVRSDLKNVLDTYTIQTGSYAVMTLSLLSQCKKLPKEYLESSINSWTEVTEYIKKERKNAIKNRDNYCYLTDSLVVYADRDLKFSNEVTSRLHFTGLETTGLCSHSYNTAGLLQDGDKIMSTSKMDMLFDLYSKNYEKQLSFYDFLGTVGVGTTNNSSQKLVTEYNGWCDFSPSEGLHMNFGKGARDGGRDYWGDNFETTVNSGNKSDVSNGNFKNCKKATATIFNPETGDAKSDQILGAMATYVESEWYWKRDEMYIMGQADECKYVPYREQTVGEHKYRSDENEYTSHCGVLLLIEYQEDDETAYANSLEAFDECQVMESIQDVKPAVYTEESGTDVNPNPEKSMTEEETEAAAQEPETTEEQNIPEEQESVEEMSAGTTEDNTEIDMDMSLENPVEAEATE